MTHLAKRCSCNGPLADERQDVLHRLPEVRLDDVKGLLVREGRHVVLEHAELVHVVLPDDVWPIGQDLPCFDVARPQLYE